MDVLGDSSCRFLNEVSLKIHSVSQLDKNLGKGYELPKHVIILQRSCAVGCSEFRWLWHFKLSILTDFYPETHSYGCTNTLTTKFLELKGGSAVNYRLVCITQIKLTSF